MQVVKSGCLDSEAFICVGRDARLCLAGCSRKVTWMSSSSNFFCSMSSSCLMVLHWTMEMQFSFTIWRSSGFSIMFWKEKKVILHSWQWLTGLRARCRLTRTHPEDGQNNPADFLFLRVGQDVGQDGDDAEPGAKWSCHQWGFGFKSKSCTERG